MAGALAGALTTAGASAADAQHGRALYEGMASLGAGAKACADCHRPSGLGNFEGGLVVPPIAGPMLFAPFDPDTARFFEHAAALRVRPAYDVASLDRLLRTGRTPDGATVAASMPRYELSASDLADLAEHLRGLSAASPAGIDADVVHLATITTPDAEPARRDAMLRTIERFVERKNGQSRHEAQRSRQATKTREMAMYRKFRVWKVEHWALQGPPQGWAAQLEAFEARSPVFAVVSGLGAATWQPVDEFCERHRVPCLLPMVEDEPPADARPFYSLRFHRGIAADARIAAASIGAGRAFRIVAAPGDETKAAKVRRELLAAGLHEDDGGGAKGSGSTGTIRRTDRNAVTVSLLDPAAHRSWLAARSDRAPVAWLPGARLLSAADVEAVRSSMPDGWIVSPLGSGEALERQLGRARRWARLEGLRDLPPEVVGSTLQALTALGEGLVHIDFAFTPEYLLELLEHGLENVVPWSPYARLAIGPGQRVASKGSWVGEVREGGVDWRWQLTP